MVELGQLLAGPFCGQLLGDFGAEVIKVEDPGQGDPMRQWGREKPHGKSLWWPVVARNKMSVTCDLRSPDGQGCCAGCSARRRPGGELPAGHPGALGAVARGAVAENPGLVITRVTGYGQTGPYAPRAGFGAIGEAMGGIRYVMGSPGEPPVRAGISLGDALAATFACLGTLVALHHRERSGRGQVVDSAIYEAVLAMMESLLPEWAIAGYQRERTGAVLPNVAPSNVYPTGDGDLVLIAANQDTVFTRLAAVMGARTWPPTPGSPRTRPAARPWPSWMTSSRPGPPRSPPTTCSAACTRPGCPPGASSGPGTCSPTRTSRRGTPSSRSRTPTSARFPCRTSPPKLSATPGAVRTAGPALGEHNDQVWGGLVGLDAAEFARLRAAAVI